MSIYEKNCELAKALNLPHKPELDDQVHHYHGGVVKWDGESTHVKLTHPTGYRKINFFKRMDILMIYVSAYGMDVISSTGAPHVVFSLPEDKGQQSFKVEGSTLAEAIIDALILYSKEMELTQMQLLKYEVFLELFS